MKSERLRTFLRMLLYHWLQLQRQPAFFLWVFIVPILMALALSSAFRQAPVEAVPVGVLDTPDGRELARQLGNASELKLFLLDAEEGQRKLRQGKIALLVEAGSPLSIKMDPSRPDMALARLTFRDQLERAKGRKDFVSVQEVQIADPGGRYIDFLLPGLLGLNIMSSGLKGFGGSLIGMRSRKLLKRLASTPMVRADFLASLIAMRILVTFLQMLSVLGLGSWLFGFQNHGSWCAALVLSVLNFGCFASLGLVIGNFVASNDSLYDEIVTVVSFCMFMLSGAFFTYERFPESVWPFLQLIPLTAFNDALRAVLNDGASLLSQIKPICVLIVWGGVSFWMGLRRFQWTAR